MQRFKILGDILVQGRMILNFLYNETFAFRFKLTCNLKNYG